MNLNERSRVAQRYIIAIALLLLHTVPAATFNPGMVGFVFVGSKIREPAAPGSIHHDVRGDFLPVQKCGYYDILLNDQSPRKSIDRYPCILV